MSATGDGDKALGGQESPVGAAGVWAEVVGAGDPGVGDSEPHGDDAVGGAGVAGGDTAGVPDVAGDDASASAIVAGVVEGLGEEVVIGSGQDGSDIWQAEEGEGSLQGDLQPVDESLFRGVCYFFVLLDLVHSIVALMYHDMLLRHHFGSLLVGQWPHTQQGLDEPPPALVTQMVEQYIEALQLAEESENEEEAEGDGHLGAARGAGGGDRGGGSCHGKSGFTCPNLHSASATLGTQNLSAAQHSPPSFMKNEALNGICSVLCSPQTTSRKLAMSPRNAEEQGQMEKDTRDAAITLRYPHSTSSSIRVPAVAPQQAGMVQLLQGILLQPSLYVEPKERNHDDISGCGINAVLSLIRDQ
ncbi:Cancer/Testis Antigen 47B [Manis pentadactyla]|nr:Cancer/Testis Antigen 47B [Manis pentadactyla]